MDEPRPIDRYGGCVADLKSIADRFLFWSERSPLRHQFFLWQGPGDPSLGAWKQFLLDVGIFPFKANAPGELVKFDFSSASTCHGFRWQGRVEVRAPSAKPRYIWRAFRPENAVHDLEDLAKRAIVALSRMHEVREWCLPGAESKIPMAFRGRVPSSGNMTYFWLRFLYECASEWPDSPSWMPKTRELVRKGTSVKLSESQDVWRLSAEAIFRWMPPDVDDFMSAWKAAPAKTVTEKPKPHWDAKTMLLMYQGEIVRKVSRSAKNVIDLLNAAEEAGWPEVIGQPDKWKYEDPKCLDSCGARVQQETPHAGFCCISKRPVTPSHGISGRNPPASGRNGAIFLTR